LASEKPYLRANRRKIMSSSDGLEILKNWHKTQTTVLVLSFNLKSGISLFEERVTIESVDSSEIVLTAVESGDRETLDIKGATFSATTTSRRLTLHVGFSDGKSTVIREEFPS
jgi:hypothetical protein